MDQNSNEHTSEEYQSKHPYLPPTPPNPLPFRLAALLPTVQGLLLLKRTSLRIKIEWTKLEVSQPSVLILVYSLSMREFNEDGSYQNIDTMEDVQNDA